jgi:hypothetical protein
MDMSGESNLRRAIEGQWTKPSEKELRAFVQMVINAIKLNRADPISSLGC